MPTNTNTPRAKRPLSAIQNPKLRELVASAQRPATLLPAEQAELTASADRALAALREAGL